MDLRSIRAWFFGRGEAASTSHARASEEMLRYHGRLFSYDRKLLPNRYLRRLERGVKSIELARQRTGLSIGYPAWNLLYYCVLCSLPEGREALVVETGTNWGLSTIILGQALRDAGARGKVHTVDSDPGRVSAARVNMGRAGLLEAVEFHEGDSLGLLEKLAARENGIDFAFLDSLHECEHVVKEFEMIRAAVARAGGKVYFDNTSAGGVREALEYICSHWGGQLVEFRSCSWHPPGNAIWQALPLRPPEE